MKKLVFTLLSSLFLSCSFDQIAGGSTNEQETGIQSGLYGILICESTNQPAQGANVKLFKNGTNIPIDSTVSNDTGLYLFDTLDPGIYSISAYLRYGNDTFFTLIPDIDFDSLRYVGIDTLRAPGKIQGTVSTDKEGPANGVTCYIPGSSFMAMTDAEGAFVISHVPPGVHPLAYHHDKYKDTLIHDIVVCSDSTTIVPEIRLYFDPNNNERDLHGSFTTHCECVDSIMAYISGDNIDDSLPWDFKLKWSPETNTFSGFIYVPPSGYFWIATVMVFDTLRHNIGCGKIQFSRNSGDILMPSFNPMNAVPVVDLIAEDTVVSINDTIHLHSAVKDTFGGTIAKREWCLNGSDYIETRKSDTSFVAPDKTPSTPRYIYRAFDNDGNCTADTIHITVLTDEPVVELTTPACTVSINDSIPLTCAVTDSFGTVVKWLWSIDGNVFTPGSSGDTVVTAPAYQDSEYVCIVNVEDDDGNSIFDTVRITVVQDIPVVSLSTTTDRVSIKDSVYLHCDATDKYGRIVQWTWSIQGENFTGSSSGDTVVIAPSAENKLCPCIVCVTDDDGNIVYDTVMVSVLQDKPTLSVSSATPTVSINDAIQLSCKATDEFGAIQQWAWSINGMAFTPSSSGDTIVIAPGRENLLCPCIVRAVDDDSNVVFDSLSIAVLRDTPVLSLTAVPATVSIYDSIYLHCDVTDRYGYIIQWAWSINGGAYTLSSSGDTVLCAPGQENLQYECIVRAMDDDSNIVYDNKIVSVLQDKPFISLSTPTPTVSLNDLIELRCNATDEYGEIVQWEWSINGSPFTVGSKGDTTLIAPAQACAQYRCIIRASDDDANMVCDTEDIQIITDPPQARISVKESDIPIILGDTYTLTCQLSSPGQFGNLIKYEWSIGTCNNFVTALNKDTVLISPDTGLDSFAVALRVTDEDYNEDIDTLYLGFCKKWTMGSADQASVVCDNDGVPYIAYYYTNTLTMKRFINNAWEPVSENEFLLEGNMSFKINKNNYPGIAFIDKKDNNKVSVKYYDLNSNQWNYLGNSGFSEDSADFVSMAFDIDGYPYVAYNDNAYNGNITVKRYKAADTTWETIGAEGFSDGSIDCFALTTDLFKTPLVAYSDDLHNGQIISKIYNSANKEWIYWGQTWGPSEGNADYISLATDYNTNGNVYVAYSDIGQDAKLVVKYFDESNWVPLGINPVSSGKANHVSCAVNPKNGHVYVAYCDETDNNKVQAKWYDGNTWKNVLAGIEQLQNYHARNVSITVDAQGYLYIAYCEDGGSNAMSVIKF